MYNSGFKIYICLDKIYQDRLDQVTDFLYFRTQTYFAMLFQDRLKELRKSHKLLQRQVTARIDINTAVYCKIENGDRQAWEEQVYQVYQSLFYGILYEELRRYWLAGKVTALLRKRKCKRNPLCCSGRNGRIYQSPNENQKINMASKY